MKILSNSETCSVSKSVPGQLVCEG